MPLGIYNFCLPGLLPVVRFFGGFSPKIAASFREREGLLSRWGAAMGEKKSPRILFHVSSVGELEQVRPVIEALAKKIPATYLLSFFSPSVRTAFREFSFVDFADYLPLDLPQHMRQFFDIVEPDYVVLNRYDIWPNFVAEARARGIPLALVNASTPPIGWFGWVSLFTRRFLFRQVSAWSYVDGMAAGAWEPYLEKNAAALVTGDPRVDRAVARVLTADRAREAIEQIRAGWEFDPERTIAAGSTWAPDEALLLRTLVEMRRDSAYASTRLMVVPHEPLAEKIQGLERAALALGLGTCRMSQLAAPGAKKSTAEILIVDRVGILAELYSLANTAYVGGGFGRSVHSVIEPAAHHIAVAFGPKHRRLPEARTLILMGGAVSIGSVGDTAVLAKWFKDTLRGGKSYQKVRDAVDLFIKMHVGAGERVAQFLEEQIQA